MRLSWMIGAFWNDTIEHSFMPFPCTCGAFLKHFGWNGIEVCKLFECLVRTRAEGAETGIRRNKGRLNVFIDTHSIFDQCADLFKRK